MAAIMEETVKQPRDLWNKMSKYTDIPLEILLKLKSRQISSVLSFFYLVGKSSGNFFSHTFVLYVEFSKFCENLSKCQFCDIMLYD